VNPAIDPAEYHYAQRGMRILIYRAMKRLPPSVKLDRDDLEQVARIWFWKAETRFDPSYGTRFSTFAWHYVWGRLRRQIACELKQRLGATYDTLRDMPSEEVFSRLPVSLEALGEGWDQWCVSMAVTDQPDLGAGEEVSQILMALSRFSPQDRWLFLAYHLEGLNIRQYASERGVSHQGVYYRLRAIERRLRQSSGVEK
jgi:RNA polymerase sigma factor (sigma-70 family)